MDSVLLGEQMCINSNERIKKNIGIVTDINEQNEILKVYVANFGE